MKIAVAAVLLACAFAGPAFADAAPSATPIEQCIRDNAGKVETSIDNLNQAVDFLVGKICAEPIAKENARVTKIQQDRVAAQWKAMCDKRKAAPDTGTRGRSNVDFCAMQGMGFTGVMSADDDDEDSLPSYSGLNLPPSAVALAARLLLDLRLAHAKPAGK